MADPRSKLELAVAHWLAGRSAEAQAELLAAQDAGAREFACHVAVARALRDSGQFDPAIDEFIRALSCDHDQAESTLARYEIADAYEALGKSEQALYYFQLVSRIDPAFSDPRGPVFERISRLSKPEPPDDIA